MGKHQWGNVFLSMGNSFVTQHAYFVLDRHRLGEKRVFPCCWNEFSRHGGKSDRGKSPAKYQVNFFASWEQLKKNNGFTSHAYFVPTEKWLEISHREWFEKQLGKWHGELSWETCCPKLNLRNHGNNMFPELRTTWEHLCDYFEKCFAKWLGKHKRKLMWKFCHIFTMFSTIGITGLSQLGRLIVNTPLHL